MRPTRRLLAPVILGIAGTGVLVSLCLWQLSRLEWKEGLITEIDARLSAEPVPLPAQPEPQRDQFLRVELSGRVAGGAEAAALFRLTTKRPHGPGYQVIVPLETDGRRVLADLGYVPEAQRPEMPPPEGTQVALTGALFWPEPDDAYTPAPDLARAMVFSRDVRVLSAALGTEPVLVVAETHDLGAWPAAERLAHNLPNNHLGYAFTWGGLAAVWAVMSLIWLRRELAGR